MGIYGYLNSQFECNVIAQDSSAKPYALAPIADRVAVLVP